VHAATTDLTIVTRWWERWPTANIGLRTGVHFDVCDVDSAGARNGLAPLLGPGYAGGPLAATGRGWHLWFAVTGAASRAAILDGVDWRGRAATVVAPPSLHANGLRYRWLRDHHNPFPACPARLLALIRPPQALSYAAGSVTHPGPYAAAALAAETDRVRFARRPSAGKGGSRNDALNRAAFNLGQLVAAELLDEGTVRTQLTMAAFDTGLPASEVRRTIASGLSAGQRHPRLRPQST
jgi:hypothetical protein